MGSYVSPAALQSSRKPVAQYFARASPVNMSSDAMNNPDEDEDEEEEEEEGEEREEKGDRRGFHAKEQERGTDGSFIASSAKEEAWEVRQKKKHCHAQKIVCILCFRKVPNMRNLTAAVRDGGRSKVSCYLEGQAPKA